MKLQLNPNPQFKEEVPITVPGQKEPGLITVTFKYRNRPDYAAWLETLREREETEGEETLDKDKKKEKGKTAAEAFAEFVLSWDLPDALNPKNIVTFLDNYPASYMEIFTAYSKSLFTSRIKN